MSDQPTLSDRARYEMLWDIMAKHNVANIIVSFNGEGDSGDISGHDAHDAGVAENDPTRWSAETSQRINAFFLLDVPAGEHGDVITVATLADDLTGEYLNAPDFPDWVNNDGGYGSVTFVHDDTPHVEVEVNIRVVSHETTNWEYDRHGSQV